jgi:hypothetical protein
MHPNTLRMERLPFPQLERRRSDAEAWAKLGNEQLRKWAMGLITYYDSAVPQEQLYDDERGF